jgi:hypothetical protein
LVCRKPSYIVTTIRLNKVEQNPILFGHTNTVGNTLCLKKRK